MQLDSHSMATLQTDDTNLQPQTITPGLRKKHLKETCRHARSAAQSQAKLHGLSKGDAKKLEREMVKRGRKQALEEIRDRLGSGGNARKFVRGGKSSRKPSPRQSGKSSESSGRWEASLRAQFDALKINEPQTDAHSNNDRWMINDFSKLSLEEKVDASIWQNVDGK